MFLLTLIKIPLLVPVPCWLRLQLDNTEKVTFKFYPVHRNTVRFAYSSILSDIAYDQVKFPVFIFGNRVTLLIILDNSCDIFPVRVWNNAICYFYCKARYVRNNPYSYMLFSAKISFSGKGGIYTCSNRSRPCS